MKTLKEKIITLTIMMIGLAGLNLATAQTYPFPGAMDEDWKVHGNPGQPANISDPILGVEEPLDIVFKTDNLERMRLTKDGALHLGPLSTIPASSRLNVGGLIYTSQGILFPDNTIQTTAATGMWHNSTPVGIHYGGNVGIGDDAHPSIRFSIKGSPTGGGELFRMTGTDGLSGSAYMTYYKGTTRDAWTGFSGSNNFQIRNESPGGDIILRTDGNVGIGVSSPTHTLDVGGAIRACEIYVNLDHGCDYVFEEDYPLMPLSDLESFIHTNKHLPEIASAKEMAEKGVGVSDMQTLLLKKVEELTLHMIALKKENDVLKQQFSELQATSK